MFFAQQDSLQTKELEDIIVTASASYAAKELEAGVVELSIADVFKIPAAFFDPARLAQTFAGVANNNDQANGLSIRGNNPDFLKWFLEGAEIVNPNHTNNAGTFSDRPSQSSGGVNILSAQLLNTTQLYKGNYPSMFNNALSGVLSMSLRPGSFKKPKYVLQAGLIGLEVATEGPMGKNKKSSYLINYRYSTVGLLSQLGLDFGGESIAFQDLSLVFSFLTKRGLVKAFSIGGYSMNSFLTSEDRTSWEVQKDQFNIRYDNLMNASGISWAGKEKSGARFNSSLVYSGLRTKRESDFIDQSSGVLNESVELDHRNENKLSFFYHRKGNLNTDGFVIECGLRSVLSWFDFTQRDVSIPIDFNGASSYLENAAHLRIMLLKFEKLKLKIGFNLKHFMFNKLDNQEFLVEPRFSHVFKFNDREKLVLNGGFYSQVNPYKIYFSEGTSTSADSLLHSKAVNLSLSYLKEINRSVSLSVDVFSQRLSDVPASNDNGSPYVLINGGELPRFVSFLNTAEGLNYGLEASFEKRNQNPKSLSPYFILNATLYQSKFRNSDAQEWQNTRYNGNYIFNLTGGKVFGRRKETKNDKRDFPKRFGLNAHLNYMGGFRDSPIDEGASQMLQSTVYLDGEIYTLKQKDYFRIDFSFYMVKEKEKYTSRISLDVQNLLNRKNVAFNYFDTFQNKILTQEQLGVIPVLNYRVEFK